MLMGHCKFLNILRSNRLRSCQTVSYLGPMISTPFILSSQPISQRVFMVSTKVHTAPARERSGRSKIHAPPMNMLYLMICFHLFKHLIRQRNYIYMMNRDMNLTDLTGLWPQLSLSQLVPELLSLALMNLPSSQVIPFVFDVRVSILLSLTCQR